MPVQTNDRVNAAGRSRVSGLRRLAQAAAFAAFICTLLLTGGWSGPGGWRLAAPVTVGFWPRLSTFAGLVVSLSSRALMLALWPAVLLLAAGVLSGRAFCGWVCPLGTTIDATDRLAYAPAAPAPVAARLPKYCILAAGIAAALAGSAMFTNLDPLAMLVRLYGALLDAVVWPLCRLPVVGGLLERLGGGAPRFAAGTGVALALVALPVFAAPATLAAAGKGGWARRSWCRYLCPLGALLGLLGRWRLLRRRVRPACTACGRCVSVCPMGAIASGGNAEAGECILCGRCATECPENAVAFRPPPSPPPYPDRIGREAGGEAAEAPADPARRGVLAALLAGLAATTAGGLAAALPRRRSSPACLRPPGAADEAGFLERCMRCGTCTRVCPRSALHPDFQMAGLAGLGAPVLLPRVGYCEYECNLCGRVCPTGAIPALSLEEKQQAALGVARFDASRCAPWVRLAASRGGRTAVCVSPLHPYLPCEENCPISAKAIRTRNVATGDGDILQVPYIEEALCIGCGECEYVCPLEGAAGVRVVRD